MATAAAKVERTPVPGDEDFVWEDFYAPDTELFVFEADGKVLKMPKTNTKKGFLVALNDLPETEQMRRFTSAAFNKHAVNPTAARDAYHAVISEWDEEALEFFTAWIEWCHGAKPGK